MASRKEVEEKLWLKRVILWRFITGKLWFRGCPLNKSQGQFFLKGKNEIIHCVYWVHIRPPVWENPCSKGRSTLWLLACGNIRFSSLFAAGDVSCVPPRVQSNLGQQKEETGIANRPPPPTQKKFNGWSRAKASLLHSRFYSRHGRGGALRDDTKNGCVADYAKAKAHHFRGEVGYKFPIYFVQDRSLL